MSGTVWDRILSQCAAWYRDRENGLLLGVCAGLAGCYGLSPLLVRIGTVVLLLWLTIPTALVYLVLGLTLRDAPLTYRGSQAERRFWRLGQFSGNQYGVGR